MRRILKEELDTKNNRSDQLIGTINDLVIYINKDKYM